MDLDWKSVSEDGLPPPSNTYENYIIRTDLDNYYYVVNFRGKFSTSIYFKIEGSIIEWAKYDYTINGKYTTDFKNVEEFTARSCLVLVAHKDPTNVPYVAKYNKGSFITAFTRCGLPFATISYVAIIPRKGNQWFLEQSPKTPDMEMYFPIISATDPWLKFEHGRLTVGKNTVTFLTRLETDIREIDQQGLTLVDVKLEEPVLNRYDASSMSDLYDYAELRLYLNGNQIDSWSYNLRNKQRCISGILYRCRDM